MPIECNVDVTQHGDVNGPIIVGSHSNTPVPTPGCSLSCSPACILPQTPGCIVCLSTADS